MRGQRFRVDGGNVEENFTAIDAGQQSRQHRFRGGAVIGEQRTDLEALPAGTNHAPAGNLAIANERTADMARRADPGAQECGPWRGKHRGIGRFDADSGISVRVDDIRRRSIGRGCGAAIADIRIGVNEAGLFVVALLRHDAIEPDHARARMRDRRIPDPKSVAAAAKFRPHDVEAEKRESASRN